MAEEAPKSLISPVSDLASLGEFFSFGDHGAKKKKSPWSYLYSLHDFIEWAADWGISRPVILIPLYIVMVMMVVSLLPIVPILAFGWLFLLLPIWGPVIFGISFIRIWHWYAQSLFIAKRNVVLLEVKMPRDIAKSPRAMEQVFNSIWTSGGETTFIDRFYEGKMRPVLSFELASFGGEVHFYIWVWKGLRDVIETAIYAQYPEVEIFEAEDYARRFIFDPETYDMYANDQILEGDMSGVKPIKSYIDFELDKDPKTEFLIDPFAQVIEVLSSLRGSEQAWIQIVLTSLKGSADKKFMADADKLVADIRKAASLNPGKEDAPESDERKYGFPRPTWMENELIQAIQRNRAKKHYMVGVRLCYIAKISDYRSDVRSAIRWIFLPFTNQNSNWLRPKRWHGPFDYPWQDFQGIRFRMTSRRFLDAYRRRSFFYPPWVTPHHVMSSESLASIWHPPSAAIKSPGLQRIPAKKSEPPPNLPM